MEQVKELARKWRKCTMRVLDEARGQTGRVGGEGGPNEQLDVFLMAALVEEEVQQLPQQQ